MDLKEKTRESTVLYWITLVFLLFSCVRAGLLFIELYERENVLSDFYWRWQECAYLLKGINPMDVIHHRVPVDPVIGSMHPTAGTVPWAYVLGNLFVAGFLPHGIALILAFLIHPVVAVIASVMIYRYIAERTDKAYGFLAAALVWICPYWAAVYIQAGNYGPICVYFIIMMVMLLDKRPVLAGVLLAFASMKPQLAFLFYIALFFQGRWKTLGIASMIVLTSWGVASMLTGTPPLVMLFQMAEQGANYYADQGASGAHFINSSYGIFTFLINDGFITSSQCLLYSGVLGIVLVAACSVCFIKTGLLKGNELLYFAVPAFVSRIWSYNPGSNRPVFILLVISCFLCLYRSRLPSVWRLTAIFFIVAFYFFNGNAIVSGINKILAFVAQKTGFYMFEHVIWFNNFFLYTGILGFLLVAAIVMAWRQRSSCPEQS